MISRFLFVGFIAVFLMAFFVPSLSLAQEKINRVEIEKALDTQKSKLENIEAQLESEDKSQNNIVEIRQELRDIRETITPQLDKLKPELSRIETEISDLGPKPDAEKGETEAQYIQTIRKQLNDRALVIDGLIKQTEALNQKANRYLEEVASLRRGEFVNQLLKTQQSPLSFELWYGALEDYTAQLTQYKEKLSQVDWSMTAPAIIVLGVLLFVSVYVSRKKLHQDIARRKRGPTETIFSDVAHSMLWPLLAVAIGLFIVYQTLYIQDLIDETNTLFTNRGLSLIGFVILISLSMKRLAHAELIRCRAQWVGIAAALLFAVDSLFLESGRMLGTPLELAVAQSYLVTTFFAVTLAAISITILRESKTSKKKQSFLFPSQIHFVFLALSAVILGANIFGYAALSLFIFERLVMVLALLIAVLMIRALVRPYIFKLDESLSNEETRKLPEEERDRLLFFWVALTFDLLLFSVCTPIIASMFGAEWVEIREWAVRLFFGFQVGNVNISASNIAIAIGLFLVVLFGTKFIQSILSQKILPKTRMEASIRQSITQIFGYVGLITALLVGIAGIGFDLTNLALIAGALSVGIGFGLQSIVSNFVSGLILLFERPIKVGDWIITASGEGYVKKISVRATEIETFDRTSIIVPNSELISSSVKNWTHKDKIGRVVIPVGVSYDSNPHQVRDLLLECAKENKGVLDTPAPSVLFKDFGDSALIFDLRVFIKNISEVYKISTQMRLDIWDVFKENDIEISFPQRDLHIRTAPGLEQLNLGEKKTATKKTTSKKTSS